MLKQSVGAVIVFRILRVLFYVLFGFANLFVVPSTCCIGGLPVINQAITAPFLVFDRAWSMYALRIRWSGFQLVYRPRASASSAAVGNGAALKSAIPTWQFSHSSF